MPWWQQPFFQVALPVILTFAIATWFQSKRIDELSKRVDDLRDMICQRLEAIEARIEALLSDHDRRITTLEERTSPLRR